MVRLSPTASRLSAAAIWSIAIAAISPSIGFCCPYRQMARQSTTCSAASSITSIDRQPTAYHRGSGSGEFQRRIGQPFPDIGGEGPHGIELEAGRCHAMQKDRCVMQAGHGEHAGHEGAVMEIKGDALCQDLASGDTFDEDAGAAMRQRGHDAGAGAA